MESIFEGKVGDWSSIQNTLKGDLTFYRINTQEILELPAYRKVEKSQQLIGNELKRQLMQQILERIKSKKTIYLE